MKRYRILEIIEKGERHFIVQKKVLFFWKACITVTATTDGWELFEVPRKFAFYENAKRSLDKYIKQHSPKEKRVVYDSEGDDSGVLCCNKTVQPEQGKEGEADQDGSVQGVHDETSLEAETIREAMHS